MDIFSPSPASRLMASDDVEADGSRGSGVVETTVCLLEASGPSGYGSAPGAPVAGDAASARAAGISSVAGDAVVRVSSVGVSAAAAR